MNGIILAGGRSLRFGEDKAFVEVGGGIFSRPLIEVIIGLLTPLFDNLIVVTDFPEKYSRYPVKIVPDKIRGIGPLAGIYSGLLASDRKYNFVMACDMPLIQPNLIRHMQARSGADILVPRREEKFEPLHAIYSRSSVFEIEKQIKAGHYKIQKIFSNLEVEYLEEEEIRKFDPGFMSFLNLNSKKDLGKISACLKKSKLNALSWQRALHS